MKKTIRQIAGGFSGREHHCSNCEFVAKEVKLCPYADICHAAFIRGFIKGRKYALNNK